MLPHINYSDAVFSGGIPCEIKAFLDQQDAKTHALITVLSSYYQPQLDRAIAALESTGYNQADHSIASWNNSCIIEVGFSWVFRAFQTLHGTTLEDIAAYLLYSGTLWSRFRDHNVTLDIVRAPASDPDPPFDYDTDYAIIVIPLGQRGASPASRYSANPAYRRP